MTLSVHKHIREDRGRRRAQLRKMRAKTKYCPNKKCLARNSVNATQCWKCGSQLIELT